MRLNRKRYLRQFVGVAVCSVGLVATVGVVSVGAATNLIVNGGFELPHVGTGYLLFSVGQSFPGWTVVGAPGNVAPISGKFQQKGSTFDAKAGKQFIDLTGTSNSRTGIEQTVKTVAGADYTITFSVGNVIDPGGIFGIRSTVLVYVNGKKVVSATNTKGSRSLQNWKTFSVKVRANSVSTTVEFINGDPSNDTSNSLDAVSMMRT